MHESFDLTGRVAVITGGCGLLGRRHARAIAAHGGVPVLVDLARTGPDVVAAELAREVDAPVFGLAADITDKSSVQRLLAEVLDQTGRADILINNAANNPKQEAASDVEFSRFETFTLAQWNADIDVGLTGAMLMSQAFGTVMASRRRGVILNIASDLALIGPDQRLYRKDGVAEDRQPVKPVTYSVVKTALLGLTRYLATYWADAGVRVNAISPGGIYNGQSDEFVQLLAERIPLGRMAGVGEYEGAILFLCSDASSYMTGANLVVDGGRSCW